MDSQDPLARSVGAISRFFVGERSLKETLERLTGPPGEVLTVDEAAELLAPNMWTSLIYR